MSDLIELAKKARVLAQEISCCSYHNELALEIADGLEALLPSPQTPLEKQNPQPGGDT